MKKIIYIMAAFLASIMLAPATLATSQGPVRGDGDVSIISVDEVSKTDGVTVNSDPSFGGLSMGFNVTFVEQSNRIEYEATIQNKSDTDYMISEEATFDPNDYLTYTYQVANPTLKAHSESKVRIAVEYTTEVPGAEFTGGVYGNSNRAVIKLLNKDGSTVNPNTDDGTTSKYIAAAIVCAVLMTAFLLLFTKKRGRAKLGLFALTIALSALPLLSFAADTIELTINAEVSITRGYEVAYQFDFPFFDAYFKSTDYDMSQAVCDDIVYVGEVSEANKYQHCDYPITKDRLYVAGETVDMKTMTVDYLRVKNNNGCEVVAEGKMLCSRGDVEFKQKDVGTWGYYKTDEGRYKTSEDDHDLMNFSNAVYDDWLHGTMQLQVPCTFTMPAHDVLLHEVIYY